MSEFIFKLPDLGEGTVESEIGEWFIKVGDLVNEEDIVCTMMTDKAAVELSSPVTGTIVKLAGEPGDIVAVGAPLVVFDTAADAAPTEAESGDAPTAAPEPEPTKAAPEPGSPPVADSESGPEPADSDEAPERNRVMTSPAIRRRAKEAGIDLSLVPGSGPGGRILRKDFHLSHKAHATGAALAIGATPSTKVTEIKIIGVEPADRQHQLSGLKRVTGLPDEHFPSILDPDLLDDLVSVTDEDAFGAGIRLARTEGAMVGPTTGAVLHAAIESGASNKGRAVLISGDNAAKYISSYAQYLDR